MSDLISLVGPDDQWRVPVFFKTFQKALAGTDFTVLDIEEVGGGHVRPELPIATVDGVEKKLIFGAQVDSQRCCGWGIPQGLRCGGKCTAGKKR